MTTRCTTLTALTTLVTALSLGCDAEPALPDPGASDNELGMMTRSQQDNGLQHNGFQINGFQINGMDASGFELNGFRIIGIKLDGIEVTDFHVNGSEIAGTLDDGYNTEVSGVEMIDMTMAILDEEGDEYSLRIDDAYINPADPGGDVYFYEISYSVDGSPDWFPTCENGQGNPTEAIAVTNYWDSETGDRVDDSSTFTFACRSGAIGKCVEFGYRPWATSGTISLADYHQACTRMVRADYCGDGEAYTLTGTTIDIADTLSSPIQSFASSWPVEAEWGPDGAVCITENLRAELVGDEDDIPCADDLDDLSDCGDAPGGRAELINRYDS